MSPKPVSASHPQSPSWPLETGPGAESLRSSCAAYQLCDPGLVSFSELRVSTPVSVTVRRPSERHMLSTFGHQYHRLRGASVSQIWCLTSAVMSHQCCTGDNHRSLLCQACAKSCALHTSSLRLQMAGGGHEEWTELWAPGEAEGFLGPGKGE